MGKILLILFLSFLFGFLYGLIIHKISLLKIIRFLPSLLGLIFLIYIRTTPGNHVISGNESVHAIEILIKEFIISSLVLGNLLGLFVSKMTGK